MQVFNEEPYHSLTAAIELLIEYRVPLSAVLRLSQLSGDRDVDVLDGLIEYGGKVVYDSTSGSYEWNPKVGTFVETDA